MKNSILNFFKTPVGLLLTGATVGEVLPDPSDIIHFWFLKRNYFNLTGFGLNLIHIFDWYFLTASYFLLLTILAWILHIKKVSTVKIWFIIGGILAIGGVLTIILTR